MFYELFGDRQRLTAPEFEEKWGVPIHETKFKSQFPLRPNEPKSVAERATSPAPNLPQSVLARPEPPKAPPPAHLIEQQKRWEQELPRRDHSDIRFRQVTEEVTTARDQARWWAVEGWSWQGWRNWSEQTRSSPYPTASSWWQNPNNIRVDWKPSWEADRREWHY